MYPTPHSQRQYDSGDIAAKPESFMIFLTDAVAGIKLPAAHQACLVKGTMPRVILACYQAKQIDDQQLQVFFKILESQVTPDIFPHNELQVQGLYPKLLPVAVAAQCPKIVAILCRTGLSPELALEVKAFDLLAPQTIVATFLQMLKQQHQSFGDNPPVVLASLNAFIEHYPQHIPEVCEQFVDLLEQEMESGALDAWDFALYCSALGNSLSKRKTTTEGIYVSPMTVDKIFDKWFPTDKEQPRFTHYKALTHLVKNRLDMEDVSTGLIRKIATYLLQKINDFETRWQIICASGDNLLQKAAYTLIEESQVDLIKWPRQWSLWSFLNSSFHYALATRDEQLMLEYVERKPKEFHKFLQSQCFLYSAFSKANPIIKSDFRSNPHYPLYARVYTEISKPNGSRKFARFRKDSALKKFFAGKDEVVEQPESLEALYQRILTVKTLAEAKAVVRSAFLSNPELFKRQLGQWLARTATLSLRVLLALLSQAELRHIIITKLVAIEAVATAALLNHHGDANAAKAILFNIVKQKSLKHFLLQRWGEITPQTPPSEIDSDKLTSAFYLAVVEHDLELIDELLAIDAEQINALLAELKAVVANDVNHPHAAFLEKVFATLPVVGVELPRIKIIDDFSKTKSTSETDWHNPEAARWVASYKGSATSEISSKIPRTVLAAFLKTFPGDTSNTTSLASRKASANKPPRPTLLATNVTSGNPANQVTVLEGSLLKFLLFDNQDLLPDFLEKFPWDWDVLCEEILGYRWDYHTEALNTDGFNKSQATVCRLMRYSIRFHGFYKNSPTVGTDYRTYLEDAYIGIDLPASFINHMTSGNRPAVILTDLIKNQKTRLLALFLKMLQEKKVQLDFAKTLGTEFYFNALYLAGQAQQFELADTLLANHDDPLPYRLTQLAGALNLPADILQLSRPLNFREKAALNQLLTQPTKFITTIKKFIERYPQHTEEICERFIALANDTIDLNSQDLYKVFLLLFFTDKTAKRPQYKLSSGKLTATAIAQIKKWFAEADDDFDVGTVKKLLEQLSPKEVKDIATAMNNPVMIWAVAFVADKPLRKNLREAARRAVEDNIIDIKTAQERWASSPLADEKQLEKFLGKFHYALATEDVEKMFKIFKRNPRKFHEQLQQAWRTPRQQSPHLRFYLKLWLQLRRQVTAEYADPGIFPNPVAVQKYKKLFESVFHYKLSKDPVCFFNDGNYYRQNVDVLWQEYVAAVIKTKALPSTTYNVQSAIYSISQEVLDATLPLTTGDSYTFLHYLITNPTFVPIAKTIIDKASPAAVYRAVKVEERQTKKPALSSEIQAALDAKIAKWREELPNLFPRLATAPSLAAAEAMVQTSFSLDPALFKRALITWLQSGTIQARPSVQQLRALIWQPEIRKIVIDHLIKCRDTVAAQLLNFQGCRIATAAAKQILFGIAKQGPLKGQALLRNWAAGALRIGMRVDMTKPEVTIHLALAEQDADLLEKIWGVAEPFIKEADLNEATQGFVEKVKNRVNLIAEVVKSIENQEDLSKYLNTLDEAFFTRVFLIKNPRGLYLLELIVRQYPKEVLYEIMKKFPNAVITFLTNSTLLIISTGCAYKTVGELALNTELQEALFTLLIEHQVKLKTSFTKLAYAGDITAFAGDITAYAKALLTVSRRPNATTDCDHYLHGFDQQQTETAFLAVLAAGANLADNITQALLNKLATLGPAAEARKLFFLKLEQVKPSSSSEETIVDLTLSYPTHSAAIVETLFSRLQITDKAKKQFMLHVAQKSKTGIADLLNTHKDDEDTLKEFRQLLTLYEKNILANDKTFNAFLTFVKNKLANPELNLVREAGTHSTLYPDNKAGLPGPAGPHPSSAYPNSAL